MIDSHVHIWSLPDNESPLPEHFATVETLLSAMDGAGVERAVLVQPSNYGVDHSYLSRAARTHADRFSTVVLLDPFDPGAVYRLGALHEQVSPGGVRLHLKHAAAARAQASDITRSLLDEIERCDLTLSVLTTPAALDRLAAIAGEHPGLRMVIDHLGSPAPGAVDDPAYRSRLAAFRDRTNVWLKLSGFYALSAESFPYEDCDALVGWLLDQFGAERLIWGSDFPYVTATHPYTDCVDHLDRMLAGRSDIERALISKANALWLWG